MPKANIQIRPATISDASILLHFIKELAIYENAEHEVLATTASIEANIFSDNSHVHALICELDGQAIGIAIYFFNYSTWLSKPGLYLEDLYVSAAHRGIGAGKMLLQQMANIAIDKGCGRFEWSCLDWNQPSRDFYESIGAIAQSEWIGYRMSGDTLINFAKA
ncbi:MAG: GNAT family N-acetyltransferase [Oceanospirillaceae bacterium]|nr:GNAT family N-acetyltransferase [Oceanospirillaceae bacterium]